VIDQVNGRSAGGNHGEIQDVCQGTIDIYILKFNAFPYFHQTDKQRPLCYLYFVLKGHYADFV
jgi:hypothetical protein